MSQYKELAWALDTYDEDDKQRDQIAAILRGLDAKRPTVNSVMYLIQQYGGKKGAQKEENAAQCLAEIQVLVEALAAPVAAQPTEQEQSQFFCGVDFADGVLAVSVMRRRPDDVAEMIHSEQIEVAAQPQQAKPLSDAEMNEIYRNTFGLIDSRMVGEQIKFVRAIEAAHGIKE